MNSVLPPLAFATLLALAPLVGDAQTVGPDPYADLLDFEDAPTVSVPDPLEGFNRTMFRFNRTVNKFVLRPVSDAYQAIVPDPVEKGLSNAFSNVNVVPRVAGSLLQGKVDRALRETGRFAVDSTVGVLGLFTPSANIPALVVPKEDIGQAFGAWGLPEGPYLVLPVLGPTTMRDLVGRFADGAVNPLQSPYDIWNDWAAQTAFQVTDTIVSLPQPMAQMKQLEREAIDFYAAMRNGYIYYRRAEVAK